MTGPCIENGRALEALLARLREAPVFAVDTETNGLHAFRSRVCIIQLAIEEESWIVDVLAFKRPGEELAPLLDLLENPSHLKLLHGSSHDVSSLKADFDRRLTNIFDTHIAARLLQYETNGLSDLVARHFGVTLEKKFQKQNWARRPLTLEALEYLRRDVMFLPRLHRLMIAELKALDLIEEAHLESRRVEETHALEQDFDAEAFWRFKGIDRLGDRAMAFIKELHEIRAEIARRMDRPVFKILADGRLVEIAEALDKKDLPLPRDLLPDRFRSYLPRIESAWRRSAGERRPLKPPRQPAPPRARNGVNREERAQIEEMLKKWRNAEALARGVSTMAVLPNHLVEAIASTAPKSIEALDRIPHFGRRRLERYGEILLGLLRGVADEKKTSKKVDTE